MEHYYQDNKLFGGNHDTETWFTYPNLYKSIVDSAEDGDHFVEVGCWKGRSACFMAVEIANSNKNIKFDCVDTWLGSKEHHENPIFDDLENLYEIFKRNMKPVDKFYKDYRMTSVEASKLYKKQSLDFIFIDACHETECVIDDIMHWLPKLKKGKIIAGQDYAGQAIIDAIEYLYGTGFLKKENMIGCEVVS